MTFGVARGEFQRLWSIAARMRSILETRPEGAPGRDKPAPYESMSLVPGAGRDKPVPGGATSLAPGAGRDKPVPYESTSFVPGAGRDKREAMLLARSGIGP